MFGTVSFHKGGSKATTCRSSQIIHLMLSSLRLGEIKNSQVVLHRIRQQVALIS